MTTIHAEFKNYKAYANLETLAVEIYHADGKFSCNGTLDAAELAENKISIIDYTADIETSIICRLEVELEDVLDELDSKYFIRVDGCDTKLEATDLDEAREEAIDCIHPRDYNEGKNFNETVYLFRKLKSGEKCVETLYVPVDVEGYYDKAKNRKQ